MGDFEKHGATSTTMPSRQTTRLRGKLPQTGGGR